MIKTNLLSMENEFLEEINEFCPQDEAEVSLFFTQNGKIFHYDISVNGKEYVYDYPDESTTDLEHKRYVKRYAKLGLYRSLSDSLKITLEWGALTGIRPVKFAYQYGDGFDKYLKEVMLVSDKKADIVSRIIRAQKPYYTLDEDNCDFFVGIPFCPSRCLYCSFISNEITPKSPVSEYTYALIKEITEAKKLIKNLRSIYIGGGTPVSLPINLLEEILKAVGENTAKAEYTVEAGRPDCITDDVLKLLKDYGVTRICINPQTFNDKTLQLLGRKHTVKDIYDKYEMALKYNFSINMDLIAGLNGENFDDFKRSIDSAVSLDPDNVTVHTLCVKKGSKLKETTDRLDDGEVPQMIDYSSSTLISSGYNPYYLYRQKYMAASLENVGYSKPGKECVYNIDTMEEIAQNIACGANSVSKKIILGENRIERYGAPKDIKTYIEKVERICEEKSQLFK